MLTRPWVHTSLRVYAVGLFVADWVGWFAVLFVERVPVAGTERGSRCCQILIARCKADFFFFFFFQLLP